MAPLTPITTFLLRCLFLTSILVHQVTPRYDKIEIVVNQFSNPGNKITSTGKCCDGNKDALSCLNGCDTFFTVCIGHPQYTYPKCLYKEHSRILTNGSDFHSTLNTSQPNPPNLVSIKLLYWLTNVSFSLIFFDDDRAPGDKFTGASLTSEIIVKQTFISSILPGKDWKFGNYSKNGVTFEYRYRVTCNENYHGEQCRRHCKERDDIHGHFLCLSNGTRVCRPGYTGEHCDKIICPALCKSHGRCTNATNRNECTCENGWTGPNCQRCIPQKECVHAYCKKPHDCICKDGWSGQHCNVDRKYCSHYRPCKNKAVCLNDANKNYTCNCDPGFEGKNCEKISCPSTCNLTKADCSPRIGCKCHRGWKGPDCNQCIIHPNCTNGYCTKPFECVCHENWTGAFCNISQKLQETCSNDTCQNNGECKKLQNGTKQCVCREGFTGQHCENVSCPSTCNLTKADCSPRIGCKCHRGWKGPDCNQCIIHLNCTNGYCTKPFECVCHENWSGAFCNISQKLQETCSNDTCQNNGECKKLQNGTKQCVCREGFTGQHCENVSCPSTCNLTKADCSPRIGCKCHRGWKGPDCNQCIIHPNCTNGYCTKPFECVCHENWSGAFCNISKKLQETCSNDTCRNNGECKKLQNGTKQCVCREGFTGQHCENVLCSPTCNKTRGDCHTNNGCSCYPGWAGRDCNQCINNLLCTNGYCTKPFECICNEGWTGESCNISKTSNMSKTSNIRKTIFSTVAISVSAGLLVCVIFVCAVFMLWRHFRRRMSFSVPSATAYIVNNGFHQSYKDVVQPTEHLDNNFGGLMTLSDIAPTEMDTKTPSVSENVQNKKGGSTSSADSGYDDSFTNSCV